ncbi:MAG: hypothetical protein JSS81_10635 [Acidobacteria bacterium]|nr:hypothetical protein [Acidobacteriota bacterium]
MRETLKLLCLTVLCLMMIGGPAAGQSKKQPEDIRKRPLDSLIGDFVSDDWGGRVVPAEKEMESRGPEVIPEVLKLLDRNEKVKLKNTFDLIYPGAETFYGHGWIMNYDVDWLPARAGWLLEELTFQDFGFQGWKITEDRLFKAVMSGKRDVPMKEIITDEQRVKDQNQSSAVKKIRDWWQNNQKWTRFGAIVDGLKGSDAELQSRIFQWLRNGHTKCDGLTIESFEKSILPEVKRLAKSDSADVRQEAELLLESHSKEKWWYRYKLERDFPDTYTSMKLQ